MLKLESQITKTAKSVNEAKEEILKELNLLEEDVNIEVVEEGAKGFLGLGSKEAKVIVTIKELIPAKAKSFLRGIFNAMKLEVDIKTTLDEDTLLVELSGENMGIVIGKRGDTLDSLQYLTSLVVNHGSEVYYKVTIDTENYRQKRLEALTSLAKRLAAKVAKTGKKYTLEPMNPYERRIIHSNLQENEEVTTFSVGEDPYRKVVIAPKNPRKPQAAASTYHKINYTQIPRPHNPNKHADYESYANSLAEETEE